MGELVTEGRKRSFSVGGSSSPLALVGVHHVMMCNWPAVAPELYKQISGETCQPEGAGEVNVCVVAGHRCGIVWGNGFDGAKKEKKKPYTTLMANRWAVGVCRACTT